MLRTPLAFLLVLGSAGLLYGADFTAEDPALTLAELKSLIIGNSWSGDLGGPGGEASFKEFIDPSGELRGETSKDSKYTAHWLLRDDGLFCWDYGEIGLDPKGDGCAPILKKGSHVAFRRLDGLIGPTWVQSEGNAFGL